MRRLPRLWLLAQWVVVLWLCFWPLAGAAQTAKLLSGEHGAFTRLVVELPAASDWRLGRTDTGYEFAVVGPDQPRYDLSTVWSRISRNRLQALWADPDTGTLQLTLRCPCHAFPYEFRPGMVVIDLRDGPAPPGSVFEMAVGGSAPSAVQAAAATPDPAATPAKTALAYDWLAQSVVADTPPPDPPPAVTADTKEPALALPLPTGGISLGPLRDALLQELSRGAAEGLIDMTLPQRTATPAGSAAAELPWSRISIGELPGLAVGRDRSDADEMLADGAACLPDEALAVGSWGTDQPAALQLADARSGLMGEFDTPDRDALLHAVRQHLYLGFGAEALQYLQLVEGLAPGGEAAIYASMARVIEGDADPNSPFAQMLSCDTAAALWAALLHDRLPSASSVNTTAVLRSFAALPPHLRQHFGAGLAERFLQAGDLAAARMVRDAMARVPGVGSAEVNLVDAQAGLAEGHLDAAEAHAKAAMDTGSGGIDAVLALVETSFRKSEPISDDLLEAVRSYLAETEGTATAPALQRAHVLALALAGHPTDAIAALERSPGTVAEVWQVIAPRATDAEFLDLAVLGDPALRPSVDAAVAMAVAVRLTDLGFVDAALVWLGPITADSAAPARLVAARAELGRGDARAARDLLVGLDDPQAAALRAEALTRLGAAGPAVAAWRASGDEDRAQRLIARQGDWALLSQQAATPWQDAALLTVAAPATAPQPGGLLAQGAALVEDSGAARQIIADLLAAVPAPTLER